MKRLFLLVMVIFGTGISAPLAQALSCAQADIQRELKTAIESDKVYHIFVGYFSAPKKPKNQLPQAPSNGSLVFIPSNQAETVDGFFTGYSLGKTPHQDFKLENLPVRIQTSCAASWCGHVPPHDKLMIAFVEAQDGGPPLLRRGPCPHMSHAYSADKEAILREGL